MCEKLKVRKYIQTYSYMNFWRIQIFFIVYFFIGFVPYAKEEGSFGEVLFALLKGFSYRTFYLTEFLYYSCFFLFPIFLIHAFWEQERANKNAIAMFRMGSKEKWERAIYKEGFVCVTKFYIWYIVDLMAVLGISLCFCKGNHEVYLKEIFEFYGVSDTPIFEIVICSILRKGMELVLLYEISLFFYRCTKQTVVSFIGTMLMYLLGFSEKWNIFGIGKSSVYQLLEDMQGNGVIIKSDIFLVMGSIVILFIINHIRRNVPWER